MKLLKIILIICGLMTTAFISHPPMQVKSNDFDVKLGGINDTTYRRSGNATDKMLIIVRIRDLDKQLINEAKKLEMDNNILKNVKKKLQDSLNEKDKKLQKACKQREEWKEKWRKQKVKEIGLQNKILAKNKEIDTLNNELSTLRKELDLSEELRGLTYRIILGITTQPNEANALYYDDIRIKLDSLHDKETNPEYKNVLAIISQGWPHYVNKMINMSIELVKYKIINETEIGSLGMNRVHGDRKNIVIKFDALVPLELSKLSELYGKKIKLGIRPRNDLYQIINKNKKETTFDHINIIQKNNGNLQTNNEKMYVFNLAINHINIQFEGEAEKQKFDFEDNSYVFTFDLYLIEEGEPNKEEYLISVEFVSLSENEFHVNYRQNGTQKNSQNDSRNSPQNSTQNKSRY